MYSLSMGERSGGGHEVDAERARWIARCARRLRQRWRTVDVATLEELASELHGDRELGALDGAVAAERWLRRGVLREIQPD